MFIGRLSNGRAIIAYESVDEIIEARSCMACIYYNEMMPCRLYGDCRAGKSEDESPRLFRFAGRQHAEKYMIEVDDKDGLKRMHIHR